MSLERGTYVSPILWFSSMHGSYPFRGVGRESRRVFARQGRRLLGEPHRFPQPSLGRSAWRNISRAPRRCADSSQRIRVHKSRRPRIGVDTRAACVAPSKRPAHPGCERLSANRSYRFERERAMARPSPGGGARAVRGLRERRATATRNRLRGPRPRARFRTAARQGRAIRGAPVAVDLPRRRWDVPEERQRRRRLRGRRPKNRDVQPSNHPAVVSRSASA
jgi:hypothetical protein